MEKRTLLKKYDIPINHLDFGYIEKCKNSKELERIVAILRSGEEGYYPQLTKCAEDKLKELKPNSRVLRTEEQILTKSSFSPQEWKEHSAPIIEWSTEIKNKDTILSTIQENTEKIELNLPPIRKGGKLTGKKDETAQKLSGSTTSHVAATNYSNWDKYDADAELLKMDLEEERVKEHVERMNRINQEKSASLKAIEDKKANANIYEKLSDVEREKLAEDYKIRGNECFKSKEYTIALEHYTRCIQILPTVAGYNNRAITNLKLLRYTDSLSDCDECLRREPTNLKALLRRAEACLGLGKTLDAYQAYEQVKVIEPDNAIAGKALDSLRTKLDGEVAPSHATRIKIVDGGDTKEETKPKSSPKPREATKPKPAPPPKPPVDYDLAELVKPNKLVKSKLAKTMESFSKLTPNKVDKTKSSAEKAKRQETASEIRLQIEDPINRIEDGKCLIEEL